jgi:RNA polymerase sigma-70 factor, ECF subfamily
MRSMHLDYSLGLVGSAPGFPRRLTPHRAEKGRRDYSMRGEDKTISAADAAQWIVAIAARQDREAFAALFNFYAPRIKSLVIRMGGTPDVGEELAQEVLLTIWRKSAYFDPSRASASAWIFTIVRNLRIDRLRRQQLASRHDVDPLFDRAEPQPPDEIVSASELDCKVRDALGQLPEDHVRVVNLCFFEGRPHEEIARLLDIPLGTVKSRLRLALGRLRKLLGDLK